MPLTKTAIAVPVELLQAIDREARQRKESRNRFINRVLEAAVRARRDVKITRALDELFADEELAEEQRRDAEELDAAGARWDDEAW